MLQLCTAPSDENQILSYRTQTSCPLLMVPISEGQKLPKSRLILWWDGFGKWKALFVSAKQHGSPLQNPLLSIGLFLFLPQVTLPEYFFSCCTVMCLTLTECCKSPLTFTCAILSELYQGSVCDGAWYTVTAQAISIFSGEAHPLVVIKEVIISLSEEYCITFFLKDVYCSHCKGLQTLSHQLMIKRAVKWQT